MSADNQVFLLALVVGCIAGFVSGATVLALSVIRSPRRGIN